MSVGAVSASRLPEREDVAVRAWSLPSTKHEVAPAKTAVYTLVPAGAAVAIDWQLSGRPALTNHSLSTDEHIEVIRWLYQIDDLPSVTAFLRRSPFLGGLLLESFLKIEQYFGAGAKVSLRVFTDPDADGERELWLLVRTGMTPEEALTRLGAFDRDWWLGAVRAARGQVTIDVDYE